MPRVIVTVCGKSNWALRPYSYLFNRYWSELQPVIIAGYEPPDFDLPSNFEFHSIAPISYPVDKWTDGLIKFFQWFTDPIFVFSYEDFWLRRTVDHEGIGSLGHYMQLYPDILRIDLSTDRLHTHDPRYIPDYAKWGRLNLIQSQPDWPYHMSSQMALWNRDKFTQLLQPNWTPWQFELQGAEILAKHPDWLVLGTRQIPCDYCHALVSTEQGTKLILSGIESEHIEAIKHWIPTDLRDNQII